MPFTRFLIVKKEELKTETKLNKFATKTQKLEVDLLGVFVSKLHTFIKSI